MTSTKLIVLLVYLVLAGIAVFYAGTSVSSAIAWTFVALAAIHLLEFALKLKTLQAAGGSMIHHFVQTMIFGIAHWRPLERKKTAGE